MRSFSGIAVGYLARGADDDWRGSIQRFVRSYLAHPAGVDHQLYVIFKGFHSKRDEHRARTLFGSLAYRPIETSDDNFDLGAYLTMANMVDEEVICCLNSHSEILCDLWLLKLTAALGVKGAGLVGATGSFESLQSYNRTFRGFPNPHIRSNAMALRRVDLIRALEGRPLATKLDLFMIESGPTGLSASMVAQGRRTLVVGRNGRFYGPRWWPFSDTFRQGRQENLLVGDNQTRMFDQMRWPEKQATSLKTWGKYLQEETLLRPPWLGGLRS